MIDKQKVLKMFPSAAENIAPPSDYFGKEFRIYDCWPHPTRCLGHSYESMEDAWEQAGERVK